MFTRPKRQCLWAYPFTAAVTLAATPAAPALLGILP